MRLGIGLRVQGVECGVDGDVVADPNVNHGPPTCRVQGVITGTHDG